MPGVTFTSVLEQVGAPSRDIHVSVCTCVYVYLYVLVLACTCTCVYLCVLVWCLGAMLKKVFLLSVNQPYTNDLIRLLRSHKTFHSF